MKIKYKIYIAVIMILVMGQACFKDKGNYELISYNKIMSMTPPVATPLVVYGDTLKVSPIIKWKYPDKDTINFEYEWRQGDSVVFKGRHLAYTPDAFGYVWLYCYVTEKSSGVKSRMMMQLQVISPYKSGWLFLTNNGGKSGLSFIRRDAKRDANNVTYYEYKYLPDEYARIYPDKPLGDNPKKIVSLAFPDNGMDEVVLMQGNSPVFLNGQNLAKKINMKSEFPGQVFPDGMEPVDYLDGGPVNFILGSNGNVYWKRNTKMRGGIHEGLFQTVAMYFEGGGAHFTQFIPASFERSEFVYLFDDLKKRFLGLYTTTGDNSFIGNKLYLRDVPSRPPTFTDLNNLNGYAVKYVGDYDNGSSYMNILKNEATSEFIYQTYSLTNRSNYIEVGNHKQELFAGNGIVTDNTVYHRIRNSTYLFFGEGSRLYFYDVNTKLVKLYHDFGAGRITKILADANSGEIGVLMDNGKFTICSTKTSVLGEPAPGVTGILYSVPNVGNVVDVTWKWGGWYEYDLRRYPG